MEFAFDARTEELREQLTGFMEQHVYPNEKRFHEELDQLEDRWDWTSTPVMQRPRRGAEISMHGWACRRHYP